MAKKASVKLPKSAITKAVTGYAKNRQHIAFTPFGDWRGVRNKLNRLPATIRKSFIDGQRSVTGKLVRIVKSHIRSQDLSTLSPPKVRIPASGEERLLISTGLYLESIKQWRSNNIYYAGVKPGTIEPESGIEVGRIAAWMEYGTSNVPDRPVWGPSLAEMGGPKGINRDIYLIMKRGFKLAGYKVI